MKVVFVEDVPNVAQAGDIKEVADGHARNYLFPKGFAVLATPSEIKRVEARRRAEASRRVQLDQETKDLAHTIEEKPLVFGKRVGAKGNIYGSVSSVAIAQELHRRGYKVEKTMIRLDEPLRKLGSHEVEIDLASGVTARVTVVIEEAQEAKE